MAVVQLSLTQDGFRPTTAITPPKDFFTVIPYENVNGMLIINVEVSGKPYRFSFDTGVALTVVNKKILDDSNNSPFSVLVTDFQTVMMLEARSYYSILEPIFCIEWSATA